MDRQLFALELSAPNEIVALDLGSTHFCCLIAWDASHSTLEEVSSLIDRLRKAGCVYFVCWGPSCEWVHDIVNESDPYSEGGIMTTWHSNESLEEALWFFLNVTWPDREFEETFGAALGITVGSKEWAAEVRTALLHPRAFSKMVLDNEDTAKSSSEPRSYFTKFMEWLTNG